MDCSFGSKSELDQPLLTFVIDESAAGIYYRLVSETTMKQNFDLKTALQFGITVLVLQMTALCEAHAANKYKLTDLGHLTANPYDPVAINNAGQVIAGSFLYSSGAIL